MTKNVIEARKDRMRKNIKSFCGERFSTTELRKICNTHDMLSLLSDMADAGELKRCGKSKTYGGCCDIWQEVKLADQSSIIEPVMRIGTDLPGWRDLAPEYFADLFHVWIPGTHRIFICAEMGN